MHNWSTDSGEGTASTSEPSARCAQSMVRALGHLWVFGGFDGVNRNDTWRYDLSVCRWTEVATRGTVPSPRCRHSVALFGSDSMFVFGGGDVSGPLNDLYVLSFATAEWVRRNVL